MHAQENVYLMKGEHVVAKYPLGEDTYITFKRPTDLAKTKSVELKAVETGKSKTILKPSIEKILQYRYR